MVPAGILGAEPHHGSFTGPGQAEGLVISVKENWLGSFPRAGEAWLAPSCSLTAPHQLLAVSVRDHASGNEPHTLQRFLLLSALSAGTRCRPASY